MQLRTGLKYIWTDNNSQLKHIHQNILIIILLWRGQDADENQKKIKDENWKINEFPEQQIIEFFGKLCCEVTD